MEPDNLQTALQTIDRALWPAIIGAIVTASLGFLTIVVNLWSLRTNILAKRREETRKEFSDRLTQFYGPLQTHLGSTKELHKLLVVGKPDTFRTLTYLIDPTKPVIDKAGISHTVVLSNPDKEILSEIIKIEEKIENLIVEKAGFVDDPELRYDYKASPAFTSQQLKGNGLLTFLKLHCQILRMAYQNRLQGSTPQQFAHFVFPREIDSRIEKKINEIEIALKALH